MTYKLLAMPRSFFNEQKGSMLLEVFAFEIQMCIDLKEQSRMFSVFRLS